jgi:predicted transposase YbfD/YdcC
LSWINGVSALTDGEIISIDGKTLCGSHSSDSKHAVHIASAGANASQLSLGQVKVDEKSNKNTTIPKLLNIPAVKGCIVTIYAMGCQCDIVAIIEKEVDYILAVKGNQGNLEENVKSTICFTKAAEEWLEEDFGHERIESRKCSVYRDLSFIENTSMWKGLQAVVKIESTHYIHSTGKEECEMWVYITSSQVYAEVVGKGIRSH